MAKTVIENTFEVLAVEFLSIVQAIDYLQFTDKLAAPTKKVYQQIRDIVPVFVEDTPKYNELRKVKEFLLDNNPEVIQ
jgi:histidine ammonia-lyase